MKKEKKVNGTDLGKKDISELLNEKINVVKKIQELDEEQFQKLSEAYLETSDITVKLLENNSKRILSLYASLSIIYILMSLMSIALVILYFIK